MYALGYIIQEDALEAWARLDVDGDICPLSLAQDALDAARAALAPATEGT